MSRESEDYLFRNGIKRFPIPNRWCVHSYYTLCPYAPDGSGRILIAGADLDGKTGDVLILSPEGKILDRFGKNPLHNGVYHTGYWQTWSPDAKYVFYQGGSLREPKIVKRELCTGKEMVIKGDMEGAPPFGEPILSGLLGMLYAAGYGDGIFYPEQAPVPFQKREEHGLFEYTFEPVGKKLRLSVAEVLEKHPLRDKLRKADKEIKSRLGEGDGLTLMLYCVRWNPDGSRFLFYFGNHCVAKGRGEPKLAYVFTSDRDLKEIHLAVDLSFGKRGVHWSWHPNGEDLIGYGPDPDDPERGCLAKVHYDGTGYTRISRQAGGGHPSISPVDPGLLVTDDVSRQPGDVMFIDLKKDRIVKKYILPRTFGDTIPPGRNPYRVCHHPAFRRDGKKVLVNTLPGRFAVTCELDVPEVWE